MNPFDLNGPDFLIFYACLAGVVWLLQEFIQYLVEKVDGPFPKLTNPYAIGYLRDGTYGALQVAVTSLVHRGLVTVVGDDIVQEKCADKTELEHPLEQLALNAVAPRRSTRDLAAHRQIALRYQARIEPELVESGLIPGARQKYWRQFFALTGISFMASVAVAKIVLALQRGHRNIEFLILEFVGFACLSVWVSRRFRTRRGSEALHCVSGLFEDLKQRTGQLNLELAEKETAMLAAVFGISALPSAEEMARVKNSGGGCGSGCGGGGCGGCGGCGS